LQLYSTDQLRNVALAGHSGCGKTSLSEALLYLHKGVERLGRVEDGHTTADYDPEETARHFSINAALIPVETKTHKINILDLPGRRDFVGETRNCMRAADATLIVVDANAPIEGGAEIAWAEAEEFRTPRVVFVNKLDKERADFAQAVEALKEEFQANFIPVALPIGAEENLSGVVDLLRMKAVKDAPGKPVIEDIPADMAEAAEKAHAALVEAAAEGDDALMEKFFNDEALTPEEVAKGLRNVVAEGRAVPVLCGAATSPIGVQVLADFIVSTLPAPDEGPGLALADGEMCKIQPEGPMSAFIFKSVSDDFAGRLNFLKVVTGEMKSDSQPFNPGKDKNERITHVLSVCGKKNANIDKLSAGDIGALSKLDVTTTNDTLCDPAKPVQYAPTTMPKPMCERAISAKSKAEEEKVGLGLHRLIEQDPTLTVRRDSEMSQTLISGMGDTHLEVAVARLKSQSKVEVELNVPRVAYRETLTKKAQGQGKYKKQSGGRGQYGDCHVCLEPAERGEGFTFEWKVVGGVIPTKYAPAVEKGLVEALARGVLADNPVIDVKASCYDGTHHNVDSSEMAFKVAASMAFKKVAPNAKPIILEPIVTVTIDTPETYMGDVMGDLNSKRGRILGMDHKGKRQIVRAHVPQAEIYTYSRELRSMTQGRGVFEVEFSHYEQTPPDVQQKIIEDAAKRREES
jgi:elongation factor G